jgi:hypothetical protein
MLRTNDRASVLYWNMAKRLTKLGFQPAVAGAIPATVGIIGFPRF